MIYILMLLWVTSAILIIQTQRLVRIVVYLGIFSAISAVCFFALGAPDVAMAEVAISSFMTIFLIVCFEKYFSLASDESQPPPVKDKTAIRIIKTAFPIAFTLFLLALFLYNMPDSPVNTHLKELYLAGFQTDIGGENAVTAIYLGYRMYDTLFEALMLLISVVGVAHMSWYRENYIADTALDSAAKPGAVDYYTIRIISPIMLLFGIYLVLNGHISPGGGFQGGVAVATFFLCRYLIHSVSNVHLGKFMVLEKITFGAIALLAMFFIFLGVYIHIPQLRDIYLMMMNTLIALKVAFGFIIIFYRYLAFERR